MGLVLYTGFGVLVYKEGLPKPLRKKEDDIKILRNVGVYMYWTLRALKKKKNKEGRMMRFQTIIGYAYLKRSDGICL